MPLDFDLPHYGDVGKRLRETACGFLYDDEVPAGEPEWEGECRWDVPALPLPVLGKPLLTSLHVGQYSHTCINDRIRRLKTTPGASGCCSAA
jgi:hypothetical protein